MSRVYNFSAGPAVLPEEVLREAAAEMLDYQGSGMSVMEMSHRSKDFQAIIDDAEKDLRELMQIPDNYKVLFVQGGGNMQFAMVPMNLFKIRWGITSSPDSGQRKHIRRQRCLVLPTRLHPALTRPFPTSRIVRTFRWMRTQITCISA